MNPGAGFKSEKWWKENTSKINTSKISLQAQRFAEDHELVFGQSFGEPVCDLLLRRNVRQLNWSIFDFRSLIVPLYINVFALKMRFRIHCKAIAPWLSQWIITGCTEFSEEKESSWARKVFNQMASFVVWVWAIYSASQLERATLGCCLEDQLMASLPMLNIKPVVNRRVSWLPAQPASK